MSELSAKQTAGLELLKSAKIDFESTHETLVKVISNIINSPAEPKYRKLRTTNDKIKALLSAPGARQLLVGSGFAEDGDFLVVPEAADIAPLQYALDGLRANQSAKRCGICRSQEGGDGAAAREPWQSGALRRVRTPRCRRQRRLTSFST